MSGTEARSILHEIPLYSEASCFLTILEGRDDKVVRGMGDVLWAQRGTPQNPVDWSDPPSWIDDRLAGEAAEMARYIWDASKGSLHPRYLGHYFTFAARYKLQNVDSSGCYKTTDTGKLFLDRDNKLLRAIDERELMLVVLSVLSRNPRSRLSELELSWKDELRELTSHRIQRTAYDKLRYRVANLVERQFVLKANSKHTISEKGLAYLDKSSIDVPRLDIVRRIDDYNLQQREALRKLLLEIDPFEYEHLIMELLRAQGYEQLEVTKPSNDKGVDIVGEFTFGISTVREAIQVKRTTNTVGTSVLAELRGSLHNYGAYRGAIYTLGKFSKQCQEAAADPRAAPITLVDGESLLDMFIKSGIGAKPMPVTLLELDEQSLKPDEELEDSE